MMKAMDMYKKHIKGTARGDLAPSLVSIVCDLETSVRKKLKLTSPEVLITARALKHIYERIFLDANKPEEFALILQRLPKIANHPDKICKNKKGRRGNICFLKSYGDDVYLCTFDIFRGNLFVVTSFIPRKKGYYEDLEVI